MDIVLEQAHKLDNVTSSSVPSQDRLLPSVIFRMSDIVLLQANNVDLDTVNKGNTRVTNTGMNSDSLPVLLS